MATIAAPRFARMVAVAPPPSARPVPAMGQPTQTVAASKPPAAARPMAATPAVIGLRMFGGR